MRWKPTSAEAAQAIQARSRLLPLVMSGKARQLRERAGMPRPEMARLVGVDVTSLWRWETIPAMPRDARAVVAWLNALDALSDDHQEDALAAAGA